MLLSDLPTAGEARRERRQFLRYDLHCRARIRIGARQYAGYLHNISAGGARLETLSSIRKVGNVILRVPDLPPLRCQLRWMNSMNAGVSFAKPLSHDELSHWARTRLLFDRLTRPFEFEIDGPGSAGHSKFDDSWC